MQNNCQSYMTLQDAVDRTIFESYTDTFFQSINVDTICNQINLRTSCQKNFWDIAKNPE